MYTYSGVQKRKTELAGEVGQQEPLKHQSTLDDVFI